MKPELTVLSYGMGQDSTALLYLYVHNKEFRSRYAPGRFLVVTADTGDEHPSTMKHLEETKRFCKEHSIEFVHITPGMGYHYQNWQGLRQFYKATNTVGSKAFPKTCTDKLKIQPIYKFLEDWISKNYGFEAGRKKGFYAFTEKYGKIRVLIGIAAGEEKRMADPDKETHKWKRLSIEMSYPLVELGLDRKGCQGTIKGFGYEVPYPSNCMLCPFQSEIELLWLYRFYPEDFNDWVHIEAVKIEANRHMGDRNLGVWGKKTLPEVLSIAESRYGHMTNEQLDEYKMSHGHCVMSKY